LLILVLARLVAAATQARPGLEDTSPMRVALAVFIVLHGLIHLLGPATAFGWADVGQLRAPIPPAAGLLWLAAAALLIAAATGLVLRAPWWWYPALPGVLLSQGLIVTAWGDAKFGTLANAIIAIPLLVAALDARPSSFRSRFEHDRNALLAGATLEPPLVTEADLAPLPPLMQAYLERMGVVGRARVRTLRVTFKAQMRSSATSPWMRATATQYECVDPPARLFYMNASRMGLPFDIFHRYVDGAATFQVRIAGLLSMVDKRGTGITHDETVTLMNDVLVMAPAAVLGLPFTFETLGERSLRATFRNAGFTVSAVLTFDDAGDLVGFVSTDRAHAREGGAATWSTPISGYREVDGIRIGTLGDANWIEPSGEWTYGRFEITSIAYNVTQ
jgi:hypothetical protein